MTEIISWLNEWDIVYEKTFTVKDTENSGWLFGAPRWGWDGWSRMPRM